MKPEKIVGLKVSRIKKDDYYVVYTDSYGKLKIGTTLVTELPKLGKGNDGKCVDTIVISVQEPDVLIGVNVLIALPDGWPRSEWQRYVIPNWFLHREYAENYIADQNKKEK